MRFRSYLVALVADLTKIWGWRLHLSRLPEVYEAMSLKFEDRSILDLVQYVVRQHAEDNRNDHSLAIAIILLQVQVDDIMTSLSTNDEAIKARE